MVINHLLTGMILHHLVSRLPRYGCFFRTRSQLHCNCHLVDPKCCQMMEQVRFQMLKLWMEWKSEEKTCENIVEIVVFVFKSLGGNISMDTEISWHSWPFLFLFPNAFGVSKQWKGQPVSFLGQLFWWLKNYLCMISGWRKISHMFIGELFESLNQSPILPHKRTWNPKMEVWKMAFLPSNR